MVEAKASGLESHLRSQIGRLFTNFDLNVTLGQLRGVRVFIVGPAVRPGVYTLPSQSTLLSAAVAAGGVVLLKSLELDAPPLPDHLLQQRRVLGEEAHVPAGPADVGRHLDHMAPVLAPAKEASLAGGPVVPRQTQGLDAVGELTGEPF